MGLNCVCVFYCNSSEQAITDQFRYDQQPFFFKRVWRQPSALFFFTVPNTSWLQIESSAWVGLATALLNGQACPPADHVDGQTLNLQNQFPMTYSINSWSSQIHRWSLYCIPLASKNKSQCKKYLEPWNKCPHQTWCGFPAQVTTAIIFNVRLFNEAFKRVLTSRRAGQKAVTTPAAGTYCTTAKSKVCFISLMQ